MSDLSTIFENVPEEYALLGGRGLTSRIINQEVPPNCDPFDPENKLIFAPGLLTGTNAPCSGRLSLGADHTAGNCIPGRTGLNDRDREGQVQASKKIQVLSTLCDNLGLCVFVGPLPENLQVMTTLLNSFTGKNLSQEEVLSLAEHILKDEVNFNERAGITKHQNDLPGFFRTEELHSGLVFDVDPEELRNIYQ